MTLKEFFTQNDKAALGFSGGVDSVYLLYAAKSYGANIKPYFIKTDFQPEFELSDAKRAADMLGVELTIIHHDILKNELVSSNKNDRCYHCKRALFGLLKQNAVNDGFPVLLDGTNASDDEGDRPGMRAISELSVLSPLKICGITKSEIRELSKKAGLFTWDKPSYSCLATRISTDECITKETLDKIESSENLLFKLGYSDFRVRASKNTAKLQIPQNQFEKIIDEKEMIYGELSKYFDNILLDLKSR